MEKRLVRARAKIKQRRHPLPRAATGAVGRAGRGGARRAVPDVQRGVRRLLGRGAAARRRLGRGDPADPVAGRTCCPASPRCAALLALMLLTDARRPARVRDGHVVPLAEQDRSRWDLDLVTEGARLLEAEPAVGSVRRPGPDRALPRRRRPAGGHRLGDDRRRSTRTSRRPRSSSSTARSRSRWPTGPRPRSRSSRRWPTTSPTTTSTPPPSPTSRPGWVAPTRRPAGCRRDRAGPDRRRTPAPARAARRASLGLRAARRRRVRDARSASSGRSAKAPRTSPATTTTSPKTGGGAPGTAARSARRPRRRRRGAT